MKPTSLLFTILLFSILTASFANAKEYKVTIRGETLKSALLTNETEINTSVSGIKAIVADRPEQLVLELQEFLPFGGIKLNQILILKEVSMLSSDAKIFAGSEDSNVEITSSLPVYRGKISDSESVNLCFTPSGVVGNFHIADKGYSIKPDGSELIQCDTKAHMVQMIKTPECGENWCKTDLGRIPDELTELMAKSGEPQLKSTQATLIAKVAIETDYETYEGFGKDSLKTAAWMLSVIANSSQIFEQEVNVKLEVSYLKVWTNPNDPYMQKGYDLMTDFYEYLKGNIKEIKRDAALLIIKDPGRLAGGLASLDALGNPDLSVLVAGEFAVTHELGHIFGSPHTHDCHWPAGPNGTLAPIDRCANENNCPIAELVSQEGTIMSYCGTSKPVFGPFVKNLIRTRAELKLGNIPSPTHEVKGKVISNGIGLPGVSISFLAFYGSQFTTTTDSNGNFAINLPDHLYSYQAWKENYFIAPLGPQNYDKQSGNLYVSEVNVTGIDFEAIEVKQDLFEPDNSPDVAKEISIDGTVLKRSIHTSFDSDYFKFQAEAGKTYILVTSSKQFSPPLFNLLDTNGTLQLANSSWTSTNAQTLIWEAKKNGTYFVQVTDGRISNYDISVHNIFAAVNSGIPGCMSKNAEWGDFDTDGDFDLLLSDYWGQSFIYSLYTNDKSNFSKKENNIENPKYGGRSTLKWTDLENDGDMDVVVGNMYGINAYYNNQGSFSDRKSLSEYAGRPISCIDPGDYDNDGDVDILFPSVEDKKIHILKNEKGIFTNISTGMPGFYSGKTQWIDFDNDGDLDIMVAGSIDGASFGGALVEIYRNENGQFYDNGPILDQITGEPSFSFGDYDLDGDSDMALAGSLDGKQVLRIYRNNNGVFENINTEIPGLWHASLNWGDFDNDGDLDLVMSGMPKVGNPNQQTILLENKNGIMEESRISAALLQIVGTSNWGDIDGDNALDLFLIGETGNGNQSVLLINEDAVKNSPPSPPANLNVQPGEMKTIFAWSPATDDKTPSKGLTYNLRIGTSPGKADILSPNSDIKTGKRLVVNIGNSGYLLSKTINGLKSGTYYWSVQTIDNSYIGSEWAPEQSFTIKSNNFPTANAGVDQTVNENAMVTLDGSFSSDVDLDNLTYKWTMPTGLTFSSAIVAKPTFTAPEVKKDSTLVFTLVVNDGIVDSPPANVKVLVKNVLTVGINEVIDSGIGVYPNPTTGVVIISIDETISGYCDVAVYNSAGIIVNEIRAEVSNEIKIDLSDLISGSYLLKINTGNKVQSKMLIKQ